MIGYTKIMLGRLEIDEVKNIAREIKMLWHFLEDVWPNGDRRQLPDIQVTRDPHGQYWAYVNDRGLTYILLYCKNFPDPRSVLEYKKASSEKPMPPNFLLPD